MFYLITQVFLEDLENQDFAQQVSSFHEKLVQEGCRLLIHSDRLETFVYSLQEEKEPELRKLCKSFSQYSKQVAQADFLFDFFTREEIENSGHFEKEFIAALTRAEER
ncbi:hypothetical protein [Ammoniphilus sp. CFH 90114]|uniref:hypothetical protein n=1 Tax=Ammoniphilus sp. CFH 90114 TaxID=2493665 RepID=UPI00100FB3F6|nr:hypothetical protein [Ammoniphilus sp. CFH 90114]RXT08817.1 hypothetical protein EIZ39_08420 [Ammoniphilus sp. CFH 90114]